MIYDTFYEQTNEAGAGVSAKNRSIPFRKVSLKHHIAKEKLFIFRF